MKFKEEGAQGSGMEEGYSNERIMSDSNGHGSSSMQWSSESLWGSQQGMTWIGNSSLLLDVGPAQRAQPWPQSSGKGGRKSDSTVQCLKNALWSSNPVLRGQREGADY